MWRIKYYVDKILLNLEHELSEIQNDIELLEYWGDCIKDTFKYQFLQLKESFLILKIKILEILK